MKRWLVTTGCLLLLAPALALAQDRVLVGSYDPAHTNSLVFLLGRNSEQGNGRELWQSFFGVRVLVYRQGETVEDAPPLERIALFGPHAVDGLYARLHWEAPFERKLLTLQWARVGPRTVVVRFSTQTRLRVAFETYQPFATGNEAARVNFRAPDARTLLGEEVAQVRTAGKPLRLLLRAEREANGAATYNDAALLRATLVKEGRVQPVQAEGSAAYGLQRFGALSFELNEKESVGFVALVGDDLPALEREAEQVLREPLNKTLDQAESRYETARPRGDGWLGDGVEALSRSVNWNRLYLPELRNVFIAGWRAVLPPAKQINLHWDGFWRALTAVFIDPAQARTTVHELLARQSSDGRLAPSSLTLRPSGHEMFVHAGRSMPPIATLCAWKIYLATQDIVFLADVYPRLKRWHEWWRADRGDRQPWRDGNGDGLLEWGYDAELEVGELGARQMPATLKAQLAATESGLDDSPQWQVEEKPEAEGESKRETAPVFNERTHTLEFTPIGLNALYALDTELLHAMARELDLREDLPKWEAQYQQIKKSLDEKLWSEEDKLYLNRRWSGDFMRRLTPEVFYVLAAGIPTRERAALIVESLRDAKKFGGAPMLPTLARTDAAFSQTGRWRGRVSAVTNYLVYLGLKRYGFAAEAAELAQQSTTLVRDAWLRESRVYDHFPSQAAQASDVISPNPVPSDVWFGGLMWLPGLEEIIALDPWVGLTIGSEKISEPARINNLPLAGAQYSVTLAAPQLTIARNGQPEIEFETTVRLFGYRSTERAMTFFCDTSKNVNVRIPPVEGRGISANVDGKLIVNAEPGKAARFKLTPGVHRVVIVK